MLAARSFVFVDTAAYDDIIFLMESIKEVNGNGS